MMRRQTMIWLVLALAVPAAAEEMARPGHPGWQAAEGTGCLVWDPEPIAGLQLTWSGPCNAGRASGDGELIWRWNGNSSRFVGSMRDGKLAGRGVFSWSDGARYEGDFVDGHFHGRGVLTFANGNRYEGDFVNTLRTGRGSMMWAHGNSYVGDFFNGEPHGRGTYVWANGDTYEGGWRDGETEGAAVVRLANGGVYEGELAPMRPKKVATEAAIRPDGRGKMTKANGDWYDGEWSGGFADGEGKAVIKDKTYRGVWARGCLRSSDQRAAWDVPRHACP